MNRKEERVARTEAIPGRLMGQREISQAFLCFNRQAKVEKNAVFDYRSTIRPNLKLFELDVLDSGSIGLVTFGFHALINSTWVDNTLISLRLLPVNKI